MFKFLVFIFLDFPGGSVVKNPPATQEIRLRSLGQKDPWRREWLPTPGLLPGEIHDGGAGWAAAHESPTVRHDWEAKRILTYTHMYFSCVCTHIQYIHTHIFYVCTHIYITHIHIHAYFHLFSFLLLQKDSYLSGYLGNSFEHLLWLFVTPWTVQPMEFSRPEYWSGWTFLSPGDLPNPGSNPRLPLFRQILH